MKCEECGLEQAEVEMLVDGEMKHMCLPCTQETEKLNSAFYEALEADDT